MKAEIVDINKFFINNKNRKIKIKIKMENFFKRYRDII